MQKLTLNDLTYIGLALTQLVGDVKPTDKDKEKYKELIRKVLQIAREKQGV